MRVPFRAKSTISFGGCNSLKMRYARRERERERKREGEREIGFESEGRTGVCGKVGVPNRGVGE